MEPKEFDIEFPRGDTCPVEFCLTDKAGNILIPTEKDEIYFTVKKSYNARDFILQKRFSYKELEVYGDKINFILSHEDTANLKYGNYVYDIQLMSGDYVKTLVLGTMILTNEATWRPNE